MSGEKIMEEKIKKNVSLKEFTTFKVGGLAKNYIEVANKNDLRLALDFARENKILFCVMGCGSNVLVSDDGFDGLVIRLLDAPVQINQNLVTAFAGTKWSKLVIDAIHAGLEGLEFSANIPGSVGGAIRGNAGAYGKAVGDFVREVEVLVVANNEISLKQLNQDHCEFGYRESVFKKNPNWIISEAVFELPKSTFTKEQLIEVVKKEAQQRCAKQPLSSPSAGCSFKNIEDKESLKKYFQWQSFGKIPAARFIEEAELKGFQFGGAKISDKHSNFIINTGQATANDIYQLIKIIKAKVFERFNVKLEEEIQYIGFEEKK